MATHDLGESRCSLARCEGAPSVRILLVDDHTAAREALAAVLDRLDDLVVVGQAGSLEEARRMLADVDVAVLGLRLPDGHGTDLISDLRRHNPATRALLLGA